MTLDIEQLGFQTTLAYLKCHFPAMYCFFGQYRQLSETAPRGGGPAEDDIPKNVKNGVFQLSSYDYHMLRVQKVHIRDVFKRPNVLEHYLKAG